MTRTRLIETLAACVRALSSGDRLALPRSTTRCSTKADSPLVAASQLPVVHNALTSLRLPRMIRLHPIDRDINAGISHRLASCDAMST